MSAYCLKNGKIQKARENDAAGREMVAIFHLTADGEMTEFREFPV